MSRVKTVAPEHVGNEILEHSEIRREDSLVLVAGDDFVLVKRARSSPFERFERLADETRERFQRLRRISSASSSRRRRSASTSSRWSQ